MTNSYMLLLMAGLLAMFACTYYLIFKSGVKYFRDFRKKIEAKKRQHILDQFEQIAKDAKKNLATITQPKEK